MAIAFEENTALEGHDRTVRGDERSAYYYLWLPAVVLLVDMFTPLLISWGLLPSAVRWLADLAVVVMMGLAIVWMLHRNHFPLPAFLLLALTVIGVIVAISEGQTITATAFGWWRMFKFPFVGLYAYLIPAWPDKFATRIVQLCVSLVVFQALVQIGQFLSGVVPGDSLAGTFGPFGVGPLIVFIMLTICLSFGVWLVTGSRTYLIVSIVFGGISSVLGEMKLYAAAVVLVAAVALPIFLLLGRRLRTLVTYMVLFAVLIASFVTLYNRFVADVRGTTRIEQYLLEDDTRDRYLNFTIDGTFGRYEFGRNFALRYGWDLIQRDGTTLLFGYGLGARAESRSLGVVGAGLQQGFYGNFVGTSALVIMQETGLVGLFVLALFIVFVSMKLLVVVSSTPNSASNSIRSGLILFTLLWPMWMWYKPSWTYGVAMVIYWTLMGYVFSQQYRSELEDGDKNGKRISQ